MGNDEAGVGVNAVFLLQAGGKFIVKIEHFLKRRMLGADAQPVEERWMGMGAAQEKAR